MVDLSSFVATFLEQHHHEDSAAPVDQGLPGDVGGLDPDQDKAGAPPAGHLTREEHAILPTLDSPDKIDIRVDQLCGPGVYSSSMLCYCLEKVIFGHLMSTT